MLASRALGAIEWSWLAFVVYMIVAAFNTKRTETKEGILSRTTHNVLIIIGALFLYTRYLGIGFLGVRFVPRSSAVILVGAALTLIGLCFATWARVSLGRNWSGTVTIKKDHELVRTGPYAYFRHPLYVGLAVALLGTALAQGAWRSLAGILAIYAAFWQKARTENAFLARRFGEQASRR
jgi:protein-S-isoprenylcysteine O-methyltransferase Ste14